MPKGKGLINFSLCYLVYDIEILQEAINALVAFVHYSNNSYFKKVYINLLKLLYDFLESGIANFTILLEKVQIKTFSHKKLKKLPKRAEEFTEESELYN